jgi:hypothetical protein
MCAGRHRISCLSGVQAAVLMPRGSLAGLVWSNHPAGNRGHTIAAPQPPSPWAAGNLADAALDGTPLDRDHECGDDRSRRAYRMERRAHEESR